MAIWEEVVKFCKIHYENCYNCPIRGTCWEERRDRTKNRTAKQYEKDMIAALEEYTSGRHSDV